MRRNYKNYTAYIAMHKFINFLPNLTYFKSKQFSNMQQRKLGGDETNWAQTTYI